MEFLYNLDQAVEVHGEDLVNQQIAIELECATKGKERFLANFERAKSLGGSDFTCNSVVKPLVNTLILRMKDGIDKFKNTDFGRNKPKALSVISRMESDTLAFITVSTVFGSLVNKRKDEVTLMQVVNSLNKYVFEELKYGAIREEEIEMFKAFLDKGIKQRVGHAYKELYARNSLKKRGIKVELYTDEEIEQEVNIYVGIKLIEILVETTGVVKLETINNGAKKTDGTFIKIHEEYLEELNKNAEYLAEFNKVLMPLVIKPKAWDSISGGGYYTDSITPLPLVRTHTKKGLKRYEDVDMEEVYASVNIAQNTAWCINTKVLDVINAIKNDKVTISCIPNVHGDNKPEKPFDIDTNEEAKKQWSIKMVEYYKKRNSVVSQRLRFETMLNTAERYSRFKEIYFAYNLDWRGRLYPVSYFSPQSDSVGKALLHFAKGEPIGIDGFQWLKIHLANCGGVDKVTFEERIKWVEENHDNIMASAEDPLHYTWWTEQDEDNALLLLASCFEYAEVIKQGFNYESRLPIAFDGSCSGNQHFACMSRDEVGGRSVNLVPDNKVNDIYRAVANVVIEQLEDLVVSGTDDKLETRTNTKTGEIVEVTKYGTRHLAKVWLRYGVNRNVCKRPTMTACYSAKEFGFKDQVYQDTVNPSVKNKEGFFDEAPLQYANFIGSEIWKAINKVSVKSMEAMSWLQSCASLVSKEVKNAKGDVLRGRCPIIWTTTDGFVVCQEYFKLKDKRVNTMFCGSFNLRATYKDLTDEIDAKKMGSSISPNFVHSYDANHLRAVVRHSYRKYGIKDLALIHDSFGCHARFAGSLYKSVRETLIDIYKNNDVLQDFADIIHAQLHSSQLKDFKEIPTKGTLDLDDIINSKYSFA